MNEAERYPSQMAERFQVRLPEGMRDKLRLAAEANNRSMNSEIIARLEQSLIVDGISTSDKSLPLQAKSEFRFRHARRYLQQMYLDLFDKIEEQADKLNKQNVLFREEFIQELEKRHANLLDAQESRLRSHKEFEEKKNLLSLEDHKPTDK